MFSYMGTFKQPEDVRSAGRLASLLGSMKTLGVQDREVYNTVLRGVLEANPEFLGVWTVWRPNALDGRDSAFAGSPGHDGSGRFVPLWHRFGGSVCLEPNTDYDKPGSDWYQQPVCRGSEMVIDPYEYRVGGESLFIASQAAPIYHAGKCLGVAGFDVHMDTLLDAELRPQRFESIEAALKRGHILLGDAGNVRYWSSTTRQLICRYIGGKVSSLRDLPEALHELVLKKLDRGFAKHREGVWSFPKGMRELVVRFTRHPQADCPVLLVEEKLLEGAEPMFGLSQRETEVAEWMAQGKSNDEIAIILGISSHTVKNHLDKIFRKIGVENRYAAAQALQAVSAPSHAV